MDWITRSTPPLFICIRLARRISTAISRKLAPNKSGTESPGPEGTPAGGLPHKGMV